MTLMNKAHPATYHIHTRTFTENPEVRANKTVKFILIVIDLPIVTHKYNIGWHEFEFVRCVFHSFFSVSSIYGFALRFISFCSVCCCLRCAASKMMSIREQRWAWNRALQSFRERVKYAGKWMAAYEHTYRMAQIQFSLNLLLRIFETLLICTIFPIKANSID